MPRHIWGNGMWIGRESVILPGVRIGDGEELTGLLPTLCDPDLDHVRVTLRGLLGKEAG